MGGTSNGMVEQSFFIVQEQKSSFPPHISYVVKTRSQLSQCLPNVNVGSFTCLENIPSQY